ncbi:hypothetical protein Q3G72_015469 [Acer saccharum]|nr:hypothetical protein Q3G72_015469 [Acer saccharum]
MEFASSILSSILSKIREYLVDSFIHQPNCLFHFKNIVEDLKKEEGNLRWKELLVQQDVERAKRNTEEIEKDVEKWLMDVQNVLEEIQRLEDDIQVKKTFLCGRCPNWRWRYKLSKRAVKKMSVMLKLQDSGKFDRVSHFTTLPAGVERPKDFISFKTTEYAFSQIMEALKNDKINMVGLSGMGGVDAKEGFVKMHNLVRDVALWITSKGENVFMVKAGMRLTEWEIEQCTPRHGAVHSNLLNGK